MARQFNSTVEEGADPRKYEIGCRLRFTGHSKSESIWSVFHPGDLLRTVPRNGCGMGIDTLREVDGVTDRVWPDEVEVIDA